MPIKNLLLIALFIILPACGQAQSKPTATPDPLLADSSSKGVEFTTEDDVLLKATYYPSETIKSNAPAILLIHMLNSTKESWETFAIAAQQAGYAVLAVDLRGHGESESRHFDFAAMDNDVDAALNWLTSRPEIDQNRIGIAGASIGANLGLRGAGRHSRVKSVVLLSPGLDYRGVTTIEALTQYGQRPIMIVAAENDHYAADSSRTLNSQALGQHQLQIYPDATHGTNIFKTQAGLQPMMLSWFGTTLK